MKKKQYTNLPEKFTDDMVDLMIEALIAERFSSATVPKDTINYTDYYSMMRRLYPTATNYFDMFYLDGQSVQDIVDKKLGNTDGLSIQEIEDKKEEIVHRVENMINKIRGFTIVYFYKQVACKNNTEKSEINNDECESEEDQ